MHMYVCTCMHAHECMLAVKQLDLILYVCVCLCAHVWMDGGVTYKQAFKDDFLTRDWLQNSTKQAGLQKLCVRKPTLTKP